MDLYYNWLLDIANNKKMDEECDYCHKPLNGEGIYTTVNCMQVHVHYTNCLQELRDSQ